MINRGSKGGIANAIKLRAKTIEEYYRNPNTCQNCSKVIEVKENETAGGTRRKKYCSRSCATTLNNKKFVKRKKEEKPTKGKNQAKTLEEKVKAGILILEIVTKEQLREKRGTFQSYRSAIAKHARKTYLQSDRPKSCQVCGYNKHVEIAHLRSVADWPDDTFIGIINDIYNLVALCPTHHWEFDNDLLEFGAGENHSGGEDI